MENIFKDIATAVRLTEKVRKGRKEGRNVSLEVAYRLPGINFGYWGFTPEACLFYGGKWKPVRDMFHSFPEETQHALTFTPQDDEWVSRVELWEKPLREALSPELYAEAMVILCEWVLRCMKRRAAEAGVEE